MFTHRQVFWSVGKSTWVFPALLAGVLLLAAPSSITAQKDYQELTFPPLRDLKLPPVERFELPNGLVVYLVEDHTLPRVQGYVRVQTGARFEPADKVGLASIVGQVMRTGGTTHRKGEEIDRILENIGASVETSIGNSAATASLWSLKDDAPKVLGILADVLRNPAFPEDKIDLAEVQQKTAIARRNDDVGSIANREFFKLIYGPEHPYARHTEYETIQNITREDLVAFHRQFFHPNEAILGLWGDFDTAEMKALVEKLFSNWPRREVELPALPAVDDSWTGSVNFIQKEDVNQTNLRIGHLGGRFDDPDYYALNVLAEILGGGLSSRLFRHIRSDLGLAYSVGSAWNASYDHPGAFFVTCGTKSESTVRATQEILKEIERITQEPVSEEELRIAKEGILNSFVFNFDTTGEIVRRLMTYEYYGYPRDFLEKFKANVEKVTAEDVLRAAQSHLQPDRLIILAVGRRQDFDQPLSALGEVNEIDIAIPEPAPAVVALPEPTAETVARGKEVLRVAIEGAGGLEALKNIRDMTTLGKITQVTPQGEFQLTSKMYVLMPDKFRRDVVAPFGEISIIYDGEHAWQQSPRGVQQMPPGQVERLRKTLKRNLERVLVEARAGQRQVQYVGSEAVNDSPVDVIAVTDETGDTVKLFVQEDTGRVLKMEFEGRSPFAGAVREEQIFSDFRTVGDLVLPFKVVTWHDGKKAAEATIQNIEVNVGVDPALFGPPQPQKGGP